MNSTDIVPGKASIIVTCYNLGAFLEEAIESALMSDYSDFEVIVVDDGSDSTSTIDALTSLKNRYAGNSQITFIHQENNGLPSARNFGIRSSTGEFILPLDGDNKLRPAYLSKAISVFKDRPEVGVVNSFMQIFGEAEGVGKFSELNILQFLQENQVEACSVFRRSAWQECGGYDEENFRNGYEDWDFWLTLYKNGWRFHLIEEVLFDYRVRPNSMLSNCAKPENHKKLISALRTKHVDLYRKYWPREYFEQKDYVAHLERISEQRKFHLEEMEAGYIAELHKANCRIYDLEQRSLNAERALDMPRRFRNLILEALRPLVQPGQDCALTIFPDHWNAGDSAIWCGAVSFLAELGLEIKYTCTLENYDKQILAARVKEGPIIICGGGNFGDVYDSEVRLRELLMRDFSDRRVIQLPQSIWFKRKKNLEAMKVRTSKMRDFHLLLRDNTSVSFAKQHFDCSSVLCPDMAFGMDGLSKWRGMHKVDILWLNRMDSETAKIWDPVEVPFSVERTDWLELGPELNTLLLSDRAFLWFDRIIRKKGLSNLRGFTDKCGLSSDWHLHLAQIRVKRGCEFLARGRILITDRLHGHILALMLGLPHVVMDNNYHKLRNFYKTWTKGIPGVYWAETSEDAFAHCNNYLRHAESGSKC